MFRKYVFVWNMENSQPVAYIYELHVRADKKVSAANVTRRTIREVKGNPSDVQFLR